MQYRLDKKSGNQLSILGFGCMRLPMTLGIIDYNKSEQLFLKAIESGVNYFDTAYLYPGSESALGTFFEKNNVRDKVFLATKLPHVFCKKTADFDKYFHEQLSRLKTDYIDYYLIHNVSSFAQWENLKKLGIEKWIEEKKSAGKIKQLGFSYHGSLEDFNKIIDSYDWDFCQIQYNYININYQAGQRGLHKAYEKGIPVFIMEPLLGGKLASELPKKAADVFKEADNTLSPAAWAFNWLWNQKEITLVLSGMNQENQLGENIEIAHKAKPGMFTDKEKKTVEHVIEIFNASYKIPCTGCNYCMPCPKGINIPAAFTAYNASYTMGKFTCMYQYMLSCGVMAENPHFASSCIKCGKCEKHCPQNIPIRDSLNQVTKRLESSLVKRGMSVFRRFQTFKNR